MYRPHGSLNSRRPLLLFLANGITPRGRWYSWRITYRIGGIHMNQYFLNIGMERETYAVVAIAHVEFFYKAGGAKLSWQEQNSF